MDELTQQAREAVLNAITRTANAAGTDSVKVLRAAEAYQRVTGAPAPDTEGSANSGD